jgi:hypothetical protein
MPNRKTFDPSEKYDHSSRPVEHAQKNDLQADVSEDDAKASANSEAKTGSRKPKPGH